MLNFRDFSCRYRVFEKEGFRKEVDLNLSFLYNEDDSNYGGISYGRNPFE